MSGASRAPASNTTGNGRRKSAAFLFKNQTYDNMFYTLVSGVPIWTAYEVLLLWAYANDIAPLITFAEHPVWLHRAVLPGALHPRGGILFRAPPAALAAALRGRAQAAPPQHQSGAVVGPVDAPDRARDLFLHDPAVLPHPVAPDPHDQSRLAPGRWRRRKVIRDSTGWWWARRRAWTPPTLPTTCITNISR